MCVRLSTLAAAAVASLGATEQARARCDAQTLQTQKQQTLPLPRSLAASDLIAKHIPALFSEVRTGT